jgi:signal transduction histidine kinase
LAAGVAHEILNPLTTVKMLTYARAEELPPDASQREDLRMIISEIERMESVLRSFLDFARLPEPELTTVALTPTIENTLALLQPEMRKRAVHPALHVARDVSIRADRSQITQVLVNLFRNAMDAMPKGGDLGITTRPMEFLLDSTKHMVQIEISDTGAGIPDHLLPRLFDPFVTGKNGGSGLGLSIAYKIVEIHGGWIEAKNNYHGGAVFTVVLPMEA